MHKNVEILIGRLATDPRLLQRFAAQPEAALCEQALELSAVELTALAASDPAAFRALAAALDPRLRRAAGADSSRPPTSELPNPTDPKTEKETLR